MARTLALVSLLILLAAPSSADACRRMGPSADRMHEYEAVFVGRVTGIHLEGYENGLLGKPDLVHPELGGLTITNGASPVTVRVALVQSFRGTPSVAAEYPLAGCTFDPPKLREKGIFFVLPGGSVVLVREDDQDSYQAWMTLLEPKKDDR